MTEFPPPEDPKSDMHGRKGMQDLFKKHIESCLQGYIDDLITTAEDSGLKAIDCTILVIRLGEYIDINQPTQPGSLTQLIAKYYDLVCDIAQKHDGLEEGVLGVRFQIRFMNPEATPSATQCALELMEATHVGLKSQWAQSCGLCMGIAQGTCLHGYIQGNNRAAVSTFGHAAESAHLLCELASAGEILMDLQAFADLAAESEVAKRFSKREIGSIEFPAYACSLHE